VDGWGGKSGAARVGCQATTVIDKIPTRLSLEMAQGQI